jgi:Spy/CpxP family protein refolding chaperone
MSVVRFFLVCLFVFAAPALAQPFHADGAGHWRQTLMDKLSLTEQQRALLEKCHDPGAGRQ